MQVNCGVFLDSKKMKTSIEAIYSDVDPAFSKAVVIKLKTKNNPIVDLSELQIFAAWFDNTWQGNPINYSTFAEIVKLGDGHNPGGGDTPVWEYSGTSHFPKFSFSLFYYDALKIIFSHSTCDGILITGSNCQFSGPSPSVSNLSGESFVFKLESYTIEGGGGIVSFGVPLYAVGLSCPPSWDENPCLAKATTLFLEQMESM